MPSAGMMLVGSDCGAGATTEHSRVHLRCGGRLFASGSVVHDVRATEQADTGCVNDLAPRSIHSKEQFNSHARKAPRRGLSAFPWTLMLQRLLGRPLFTTAWAAHLSRSATGGMNSFVA